MRRDVVCGITVALVFVGHVAASGQTLIVDPTNDIVALTLEQHMSPRAMQRVLDSVAVQSDPPPVQTDDPPTRWASRLKLFEKLTPTGDGWPLHIALGSFMTLSGADLSETMFCLGARTCLEANPVFLPFTHSPLAAGAVKMSLASAVSAALLRLHRDHPARAFWISAGLNGFYAWVVIHNAQVIRSAAP